MTAYPLLSRVCAITPAELTAALDVASYDELLDVGDLSALESKIDSDELERFDLLVDLLLRPDMKHAMTIASVHALRDVEKYRDGRGRRFRYGARLQRSVIGYTTRSTVKPSPFSHFTRLGYESDDHGIVEDTQIVPTHGTAAALSTTLERARSVAMDDCILNPTLRMVDGRVLGWRAQYLLDGGFAWRSDEIVDATHWLTDEGQTPSDVITGNEEDRTLQILDGTMAWRAETVPTKGEETTATGRKRIDPVTSLGVSAAGRPEVPSSYHIVTEGRRQPVLDGSPAVSAIETWLRSRLRIVSTYTDMVAWARAEFGEGTEVDLSEFLTRSMLKFEESTPRMQMRPPTNEELSDVRFAPPMAAVFWQRCPTLGDDVVVANNSNGPGLGAALRWGGPIAAHAQSQLQRVEQQCDIELVPFTFGDEWNGIQGCGDAAYSWPSGRQHRPSDLPLSEFSVRPRGNGIDVLRNGRPVVPVYAGAMPEHRITGTARIFGLLGHPWAFEVDFGRPETECWPRIVENNALVKRRAGAMVAPELMRTWKSLPLPQAMIELRAWTERADLPSTCFWRGSGDVPSTEASKRKPAYVDFASPHLVAAFLQTAPNDVPVMVEEALPNSRTATGPTEEFVSLFVLDDERK